MNLQAYLQRIGYRDSILPTAAALRGIHVAHLQHVPFENLDNHLGVPVDLALDALFEKIVMRHRGGFCYELNGLFAWLLRELGFQVTLLSASDAYESGDFGPEYDHLTLQVACPADPLMPLVPWLADVGWGDTFCEPLRLDRPSVEQPEGLRAYRIDQDGCHQVLSQRTYKGHWEKQYRFTLEPRQFAAFEPMSRHHQTSLKSPFVQRRICTLATPRGRITLDDRKFIRTEDGRRMERTVGQQEYLSILRDRFGIELGEQDQASIWTDPASACL